MTTQVEFLKTRTTEELIGILIQLGYADESTLFMALNLTRVQFHLLQNAQELSDAETAEQLVAEMAAYYVGGKQCDLVTAMANGSYVERQKPLQQFNVGRQIEAFGTSE